MARRGTADRGEEAELTLDPNGETFDVTILKAAPAGVDLTHLRSRWTVSNGLVATAIVDPPMPT